MSELKRAILEAKYVDMIELGDYIVRDCWIPDVDLEGNLMPQANEFAAAIFRWAAQVQQQDGSPLPPPSKPPAKPQKKE